MKTLAFEPAIIGIPLQKSNNNNNNEIMMNVLVNG